MDSMDYEKILSALPGMGVPIPEGTHDEFREDLAYILSSLSRLFFSTYYINLEQDTYRAVTQLRRVESVLADEVNFTAALHIYAQHFIHPDDREEYLRVMNVDNLRQELRWWNPFVAVEYRRPAEEPDRWDWVRATAAIARTDENDLPLTAVYAAQNINGGRRQQ